MTVTNLCEVSKARSKVYIDDEFAFVLYKGELRLYHIKQGQDLAREDYQEIMEKVLPKRAKLRSMNLLKSREYTEKQLRDKLRQGFYPESIIEEAVEYVKSYHYVDDYRYAEQYVTCQLSQRSKKRIQLDLMKKGISKELIDQIFRQTDSEELEENEIMMIKKLMEKKRYNPETATPQEKMKLFAFLYRKGYSADNIKKVIQFAEVYD